MKKLNITKKQFGESKYFTNKYGTLKYVSENGKFYRTSKGHVLKFVNESSNTVNEGTVDDELKLLDQYCSGIRGNLNDSTDPDGISIKSRIANFIGWKDSKSKGKFDDNNGFVTEGAGAGYDITVKEIEIGNIVSVKLGDDKGSWAEFEATIKPCYAWVTAEGYYDVFCQDETVGIDGGIISGEVFDIDYFESEEEALEYAKSELEGRLIDIKTMYGAGWSHQYLPEDGDITFKGDLKNTDHYNISAINIKSQEMSAVVNAGHDDVYSDDNEDEKFDESWLGDKAKAGWNKIKDGAKKVGKAIGDAFNGPFRKGDHVEMTGQNGESIKGTITGWDMGGRTYTVLLGNNYDESPDDDDVVEGIPNWAISYIMYDDPSGIEDSDQKMVDEFIADLAKDNLVLVSPIDGTENEFNPYPAFGDACDTTDWSCRKI